MLSKRDFYKYFYPREISAVNSLLLNVQLQLQLYDYVFII